jgi:hypothetical protein
VAISSCRDAHTEHDFCVFGIFGVQQGRQERSPGIQHTSRRRSRPTLRRYLNEFHGMFLPHRVYCFWLLLFASRSAIIKYAGWTIGNVPRLFFEISPALLIRIHALTQSHLILASVQQNVALHGESETSICSPLPNLLCHGLWSVGVDWSSRRALNVPSNWFPFFWCFVLPFVLMLVVLDPFDGNSSLVFPVMDNGLWRFVVAVRYIVG